MISLLLVGGQTSSSSPSHFAVAVVLLKTIRASSGSRVSEGGGLLGRRLPHKRRAASTAWSLSPGCAQQSHVVGRLVGALCSLPPKAFLPPLSFDTPFSSHRCRRHLSARGMPFVCRHSSRPASIDPAPPLTFFAAPVRSPLPLPMPPSSPQLAS